MLLMWRGFDARVMVVFAICLAFAESMAQLRWRLQIVCTHCGFDPVLYTKDPIAASTKVKQFLDRRAQDPESLLRAPLNLPKVSQARVNEVQAELERAKKKGSKLLSRSI